MRRYLIPKTFSAANASSGKVFPPHLQETLHKASKQHGYESKFWVTAEGMKRFGVALKDPDAKGIEAAYKDSKNIWYNADQTTRPSIVTFSQPIFFSGKAVPFTMHTALRKAKCEKRYLSDTWIHATSIPRLPHLGGVKPGEEPVLVPDIGDTYKKVYNIEQMMNPKGKRMSSAITGRTYPDEVQTVLVAASKERGFTSPLWVSAKAITSCPSIIVVEGLSPVKVAERLYYNIQQVANPEIVGELRDKFARSKLIPPTSGLSGKPYPSAVADQLRTSTLQDPHPYWVTEPELLFFNPVLEVRDGQRPLKVAEDFSQEGYSRDVRAFYNARQLKNPEVLDAHIKRLSAK